MQTSFRIYSYFDLLSFDRPNKYIETLTDFYCCGINEDGSKPKVYIGETSHGMVTLFVTQDGSAVGFVDTDPEGFIDFIQNGHTGNHPGCAEYEFDVGTFNVNQSAVDVDFAMAF